MGSKYTPSSFVAFTDGSVSNGRASWAVCFDNSWLREHYHLLPDESSLSFRHFHHHVVYFGSLLQSNEGSSIFDAELQAIARAILAVPVTASLTIYSDSLAAILSIRSFPSKSLRSRSRSSGFPLLSLIDTMCKQKDACGAFVVIRWVAAHTNDLTHISAGNRIVDLVAKHFTLPNTSHHYYSELPLTSSFHRVSLYHNDRLIVGDPRKYVRKVVHSSLRVEWERSRTQSRFSKNATSARALWDAAITVSPSLCSLVLKLCTDTLQWIRNDDGVVERLCPYCKDDVVFDVTHCASCFQSKRQRCGSSTAINNLLSPVSSDLKKICHFWSTQADLLGTLKAVGIVAAVDTHAELAGVVGLFSQAIAKAALIRRSAPIDVVDGILTNIRISLLTWLSRTCSTLT